MKKLLLFLTLPFLFIEAAPADDQLRSVQSQLKSDGFYYGDITGQESTEMTAAIRRYQIRNGLEVTGALNPETLHALGIGGASARTAPSPSSREPAPTSERRSSAESDQAFLRQEEQKRSAPVHENVEPPSVPRPPDPSIVPAPAPAVPPPVDLAPLFTNTPYFNAPRDVQQETLRRAQAFLADSGFYREQVDGVPGPATEEALLSYQRSARLPLSGRLDLQTLGELHLLPGRGLSNPPLQPFYPDNTVRDSRDSRDYPPRRVYRGIQVD